MRSSGWKKYRVTRGPARVPATYRLYARSSPVGDTGWPYHLFPERIGLSAGTILHSGYKGNYRQKENDVPTMFYIHMHKISMRNTLAQRVKKVLKKIEMYFFL